MKNYIYIFTITCLLSCCTYFKNDEKKNITKKNKDFNTTKKLTNESFSDFITQFHRDSVFQIQRVAQEVTGFNSDYEESSIEDETDSITNFSWGKGDLIYYLNSANKAINDSMYTVSYKLDSEDSATEKIYIPQSSCFYILSFSKINGHWYLSEFVYNEM